MGVSLAGRIRLTTFRFERRGQASSTAGLPRPAPVKALRAVGAGAIPISFNPIDLVGKTRDKIALTRDEAHYLIEGALDGRVSKAQIGAWAVAAHINGLTDIERGYLEEISEKSLRVADMDEIQTVVAKTISREELSRDEIFTLVKGIVAKEGESGFVSDLQVGAWLMAVRLNGLTENETAYLSEAMWKTGGEIDLSGISRPTCDKHAAGGSCDVTSFIIAPLLACFGVSVPMMSGRMLAHTGGTLDKLESIAGFRVNLDEDAVLRQMRDPGLAIFGQMDTIAPADKRLYALRNLTGTVQSVPLIAASIISKKLAEGAKCLALVGTYGSGAFARTAEEAKTLSKLMMAAAKKAGRKVVCFIVDMGQPLAPCVGPALEMQLAIRTLKGEPDKKLDRLTGLSVEIAAKLLVMAGVYKPDQIETAKSNLLEKLRNGEAFEKFRQMIVAQGGDDSAIFPRGKYAFYVYAPRAGYVRLIKADEIGNAVNDLGAGRTESRPDINHGVGVEDLAVRGDYLDKGAVIGKVFADDISKGLAAVKRIRDAYVIGVKPVPEASIIYEVIE